MSQDDLQLTHKNIAISRFTLADYQLIGLNWLAVIHSQNMNGILADEVKFCATFQLENIKI